MMWKQIPGWEGYYSASRSGLIRSDRREINWRGTTKIVRSRILKPATNQKGYLVVGLSRKSKLETHHVAKLVASTFILNLKKYPQINHKDGDKKNNNVPNLEWVSNRQNMDHAIINDLVAFGSRSGRAKLTEKDIPRIVQMLDTGIILRIIAQEFGVARGTIEQIRRGDSWQRQVAMCRGETR